MNRVLIVASLLLFISILMITIISVRGRVDPWMHGVTDPPAPAVTVRVLDVGQGDAIYIHNGESRVLVDGGPDETRMGALLDSLQLNGTTIDVVVLSHAHFDHYNGLLALFDSRRNIRLRYFFENQDPSPASTLARLRDSVLARVSRGELEYRSTDDPCGDGRPLCTIALRGGALIHIMRPLPLPAVANDRSVALKLVGPDSASLTMWLAGDGERSAIGHMEAAYGDTPGIRANIMKADHHGSCNGISDDYLALVSPDWVIASLGAVNDYGHMHAQAKATLRHARVPWYRTDVNGTITVRSSGTPGSGYSITPSRGERNADGRERQSVAPGGVRLTSGTQSVMSPLLPRARTSASCSRE